MAVGDQIHWVGGYYASANCQPSSGVEVIIKDVVTGPNSSSYSSNYHWALYRSGSTNYAMAVIGGTGRSSYQRASLESSTDADSLSGTHNRSVPINNGNYIQVSYVGSGGNFKVAGYITKE